MPCASVTNAGESLSINGRAFNRSTGGILALCGFKLDEWAADDVRHAEEEGDK